MSIGEDEVDHELTLVRIAENQSVFREANERIEVGAEGAAIFGAVPFICECPRRACTEIVRLTLDQYEDVRAVSVRFFTIRGHQDIATEAGAARVVEEREGYVVVDKVGVAGEVARRTYDALAESRSSGDGDQDDR